MLRSDKNDIQSLIDYIRDIKPFHSKLTDVLVEYQHHDTVAVGMSDSHRVAARLSSTWEYNYISNGVVNRYRLPAVCLPRYSMDGGSTHLWTFRGVVDAVPEYPTAYRVPYNNGMEVRVNGNLYTEGVEYVLTDPTHDTIFFLQEFAPVKGDVIEAKLINIDRLFINVNGTWAQFKVKGYVPETERFDPYNDGYDSCSWGVFVWGESSFDSGPCGYKLDKDQEYLHAGGNLFPGVNHDQPIGHIRVVTDAQGGEYYTFVFEDEIFKNFVKRETKLLFRVEQADTYNNMARTVFTETLKISDMVRYKDSMRVSVVENVPKRLGFDIPLYDAEGFDQEFDKTPFIAIREGINETFMTNVTERMRDRYTDRYVGFMSAFVQDSGSFRVMDSFSDFIEPVVIENFINGFDLLPFDTVPLDYTPDFIRFIANADEPVATVAATSISEAVSFRVTDVTTNDVVVITPEV
jgi:hypothetical protein